MAAGDLLADPAAVAAALGVPTDDPKMLAKLKAASDRFRGAVGWNLSAVPGATLTRDGRGTRRLLLPVRHVTAVASVTVLGQVWTDGADYEWSEDGLLKATRCCWPDRYRAVVVVLDYGYDPVPAYAAEAVGDQAQALYNAQPGIQQVTSGSESVAFGMQAAVGVTAQWSAAVARYQVGVGDEP